jgi:DNA-binding NarL/FixJ family response regulator/class 3 adenylate cyclase
MLGAVVGPFVTLLIADPAGAAARLRAAGDEGAAAARRAAFAALREVAAAHGGREVRAAGDGLTVAFAGAAAAVRCAVDMQRATTGAAPDAPVRIGLSAGEPAADGDELSGAPVEVARRLCETAAPGGIVATDVVRQIAGPHVEGLIHPAGALRLPGVPERVAVAEVRWRPDDEGPAPAPEPAAAHEITVVIADDQRLLRTGFRVIVDSEPDMRVVGEAPDGEAAVDIVRRRRPDVVLMDIRMPELDGLQAARRILDDPGLATAVVMLTTFDRDEYVYEALRIGASGFLLKDTPADRLLDAIRVAASGDALLAPSITRRLIERFAHAARPAPDGVPAALSPLTARELDVLRLVARGLSNAEIAGELVLGENTVKTHVARVLGKLGLRDRVQAVVLAYETGLVAPEG